MMSDRFYITGLPRSRTAWLARLFSHGSVACFHDPFRRFASFDAISAALESTGCAAKGISDSGLSLVRNGIDLPKGRWLIVRRDFDEAARAFQAMPKYPFEDADAVRDICILREIEAGLKDIQRTERCLVIDYDKLDTKSVMRGAWEFLTQGAEKWCDWHWREMRSMRIVTRPEVY